tara:strand:+ start:414 stop:1814 length:1401 start_codon:yes stop_codon:yes gene_type:complete
MLNLINEQSNCEIALISNDRNISYEELKEKVNYLSKNFDKGSINLLICSNTIESIILYLSLLKSGAVILLLSNQLSDENIIKYANKYKASNIISQKKISLDIFNNFWNFGDFFIYKNPNSLNLKNTNLALLLTTSGSTGNPKVVKISKNNLLSNTLAISKYLKLSKEDRHITTLPMNYTYGLSCINTFLFSGASIVLNNHSILEKSFWELINNFKPSSISGVPYTYEILNKIGINRLLSTSINVLTQAGGKLDRNLLTKYADLCKKNNCLFYVMYGQTEATARMSYLPPEKLLEKIDSIGIPIPGGQFEIDKSTFNNKVFETDKEYGELVYKGGNVSLGYAESFSDLNNIDDFKSVLHTGDIGYKDKDGFYYVVGRKNRFAKILGIRVSLQDIEDFLEFLNTKCLALSDDKKLVVYIECKNFKMDKNEIRNILVKETTLPPLSIDIKLIPEFPRKENGKINYQELK